MSTDLASLARETVAPSPPLDCWSWHLKYVATAPPSEGGRRWSPKHARVFRHWHDVVTSRLSGVALAHDPFANRVEEIYLVTGTQIGKDRGWMNAVLAYAMDCYPRPIGYVMPRSRDLGKMVRGRIRPLITKTPRLERHLPRTESARADALAAGLLTVGASQVYTLAGGVANDLRSNPLRLEIINEFDIYPLIVQDEGDPIELLLDRMKSFPRDRLLVGGTTCTWIEYHGWKRLCLGSHERLLLACLNCGVQDWLDPDRIIVTAENALPGDILADDLARWRCHLCQRDHTSDEKDQMIAAATEAPGFTAAGGWVPGIWRVDQSNPDGKWRPQAEVDPATGHLFRVEPPRTSVRSGWLNALYSPDISLGRFHAHELQAKLGGEGTWRTHLNTWRAYPQLPRIEPAPSVDNITAACRSTYALYSAPELAQKVIIACDQQGNQQDACWFPFVVRAFGAGGESWLVDAGQVHGWDELELLQQKTWTIAGVSRIADLIVLDGANGTMRVRSQTWSAGDARHRLVLRGVQFLNAPWIERRTTQSREKRNKRIITGARVFSFDSTGWKNELDLRIRTGSAGAEAFRTAIAAPDPEDGSPRPPRPATPWHLPAEAPDFFLQSLTSEERVQRMVRIPGEGMRPAMVWQKRAIYDHTGALSFREDNHWWDAETMALVGADIAKWNQLQPIVPVTPDVEPTAPPAGAWVDASGWNQQ